MKKTLLTMAALAFGFTSMFAADIVETNKDFTAAGDSWMPTSVSDTEQEKTSTKTNLKWKFLQVCSAKANNVINFQFKKDKSAYMETTPGIECEKIILNVTSAGSKGGIDVYVGETSIVHQDVLKGGEFTFDIPAAYQTATTAFKIMNTKKSGATGGNQINIHSITFKEKEVGGLADPEITFPQSSYDVKLGEPFDAPVATAKSDGTITYTSSDESVATVDAETGAVEILAAGTTTITAKIAATQTYSSGNAQYTISVTDPTVIFKWAKGGEEVFTFEQVSGTVQPWSYDSRYGLKGSAYKNGINACEAIAASPVIDLEGKKEITLNFRNAFNNYKVNNNMIDVADFPGKYAFIMVKEEGANDWTELCEPTAPAEFSWNFYDNDVISLDAYKDKRIQFGFKYVSTEDCAGTWEVDNIIVNGKVAVGVANIEAEENVAPVYYNLQGVRVANPQNGLYIQVKGGKSSKVLVK